MAKQSKFGPSSFVKPKKEYTLVQLNEKELNKAMSDATKSELG